MGGKLDASILANADRSFVVAALAKIANKTPNLWLPGPHAAATGGLALKWPGASKVDPAEIIDAVAMSGPTHCVDGWGFVSRALSSLVAGDYHAARHMAYYGQLRAGLSLLANLGVGVFDGVNLIVDAKGQIHRIDPGKKKDNRGLGTHSVVWLALKTWANDPSSAAAFLELVRFRGSTLKDLLTDIWPTFSAVGAAGSLIEAWGLDLKTGLDERKHRNISSYAPQALNPLSVPLKSTLRFLEDTWRLFEPSASGSFDTLDRHLFRSLVWTQRTLSEPTVPLGAGSIATEYNGLPAAVRSLAGLDFLVGTTEPKTLELLRLARAKTSPPSPLHMISRALLLLRLATSFTQASLTEAGVDRTGGALRPWLDELASARGFWPTTAPLQDVDDLWEDTKVALADLNTVRGKSPSELYNWRADGLSELPILTEAERIVMWSFSR